MPALIIALALLVAVALGIAWFLRANPSTVSRLARPILVILGGLGLGGLLLLAVLFMPGTYGTAQNPLKFQVGYYTDVAGLGASPNDVTINGEAKVHNQCFGPNDCTALVNFWRSLANLTINVPGATGCEDSAEFWATSQATSMRRVQINGFTSLMDYC